MAPKRKYFHTEKYFSQPLGETKNLQLSLLNAGEKSTPPYTHYATPNAKSDRCQFFNSVIKEIYDAAYTTKQSRFQAYLKFINFLPD